MEPSYKYYGNKGEISVVTGDAERGRHVEVSAVKLIVV
jgi:hypothetical protein